VVQEQKIHHYNNSNLKEVKLVEIIIIYQIMVTITATIIISISIPLKTNRWAIAVKIWKHSLKLMLETWTQLRKLILIPDLLQLCRLSLLSMWVKCFKKQMKMTSQESCLYNQAQGLSFLIMNLLNVVWKEMELLEHMQQTLIKD
jgi:hypothetical protein